MTLRLTLAAAAGGALGAVCRWLLSTAADSTEALWVTVAINVAGCALMALLPAIEVVRRSEWLPVFLGTGVLGGFTTMSTAAVLPLAHAEAAQAVIYVVTTLAACLISVWLVEHCVVRRPRRAA